MQTFAENTSSVTEHRNLMEKVKIYVKLISEATRQLNNNKGSYRRDIWQYLLDIYGEMDNTLQYPDFL